MAITAGSKIKPTKEPIPPCGACRQAISEYEVKQNVPIEIYFMGETGKIVKSNSLANLLYNVILTIKLVFYSILQFSVFFIID